MDFKINIPQKPQYIINTLQNNGYKAYIVGGCVRDSLIGIIPHDWDICTSALPEEIVACFHELRHIDNGIKHGTVSLLLDDEIFEVTTFRAEEGYTDHRHPDKVLFSVPLEEDLKRRDFTINAMAYNSSEGLIDIFNGKKDLQKGIIRCVGLPETRFTEDALRILRALRFAGRFNFEVSECTLAAAIANKHLLKSIAYERMLPEIEKIFTCDFAGKILTEYRSIINEVVPLSDFDYNIINDFPVNFPIRLAAVLYIASNDINIDNIIMKMRLPNIIKNTVLFYIQCLSNGIPNSKYEIRKLISKTSRETVENLFELYSVLYDKTMAEEFLLQLREILNNENCFNICDLEINGIDIMKMGVQQGTEIGRILNELLDDVLNHKVLNEHKSLMETVKIKINADRP